MSYTGQAQVSAVVCSEEGVPGGSYRGAREQRGGADGCGLGARWPGWTGTAWTPRPGPTSARRLSPWAPEAAHCLAPASCWKLRNQLPCGGLMWVRMREQGRQVPLFSLLWGRRWGVGVWALPPLTQPWVTWQRRVRAVLSPGWGARGRGPRARPGITHPPSPSVLPVPQPRGSPCLGTGVLPCPVLSGWACSGPPQAPPWACPALFPMPGPKASSQAPQTAQPSCGARPTTWAWGGTGPQQHGLFARASSAPSCAGTPSSAPWTQALVTEQCWGQRGRQTPTRAPGKGWKQPPWGESCADTTGWGGGDSEEGTVFRRIPEAWTRCSGG